MALPELLLPAGLPAFLAEGHAIELVPLHADIAMRTGHTRKRRVFTVAPRLVDVGLRLTANQMATFAAWFENSLQAGAQWFTASVANQGPGLLYWQARFEAPYTAEPGDAAGSWRVTARLRLIGEGSATAPVSTSLMSDVIVALVGSANLVIEQTLSSDVTVALLNAITLSSDVVVALSSIRNGAPASAVDFDKRWIWMRYPYAFGRSADVTDASELDQRSWFGL